jgi:hypothetical protein
VKDRVSEMECLLLSVAYIIPENPMCVCVHVCVYRPKRPAATDKALSGD